MGKEKRKKHKVAKFDPVEINSSISLQDEVCGTVSNVVEMVIV